MRAHVLFQNQGICLARYDHPPSVPHFDPDREEAEAFAISFIEQGSFRVHRGKDTWRLSRGALFVTRPGMSYRCSHDSRTPDDVCLSLHCSAELVEEAVSASGRTWDDVVPVAPLTNRLAYLHGTLREAAACGVDRLAVTSLAHEILTSVLNPGPTPRLHRHGQLAWYTKRVDAARDLMEQRFADPLTIQEIGREVGISAFHFTRVFRELVGVPPHRYLVRVRLARAAEALRRGASVTSAGRDAGFPNLGNFIRQFRRAHGVSPSRYDRGPSRASRAQAIRASAK